MTAKQFSLALALMLGGFSTVGAEPPAGWKVFTPADNRFRVALPDFPDTEITEAKSLLGKTKTTIHVAHAGAKGPHYLVAYSEGRPIAQITHADNRDEALTALHNSYLLGAKAQVLNSKAVQVQSFAGREFWAVGTETPFYLRTRIVFVDGRVYFCSVSGTSAEVDSPTTEAFFASFQIATSHGFPGEQPAKDTSIPAGWHKFAPANGGFLVALPKAPKVKEVTKPLPVGEGKVRIATVDAQPDKLGYLVLDVQFPKDAIAGESAESLLMELQTATLEECEGKILSQKAVTICGYPGREIVADAFGGMAKVHIRVVVMEDRAFVLVAVVPLGQADSPDIGRFFDSFQLTTSHNQVPPQPEDRRRDTQPPR